MSALALAALADRVEREGPSRDRPILFSAPMVRALLAGTKTQTRRILKPQPKGGHKAWQDEDTGEWFTSGYGEAGDWGPHNVRFAKGMRLWVRETWQYAPSQYCHCPQPSEPSPCDDWLEGTGCRSNRGAVLYRADAETLTRQRPSIFMPRWASRLTLTVTDVRIQRLQDITEEDAKAEGAGLAIAGHGDDGTVRIRTHRTGFVGIWNEINGNWLDNPWVVALTFTVERNNIDDTRAALLKEATDD